MIQYELFAVWMWANQLPLLQLVDEPGDDSHGGGGVLCLAGHGGHGGHVIQTIQTDLSSVSSFTNKNLTRTNKLSHVCINSQ